MSDSVCGKKAGGNKPEEEANCLLTHTGEGSSSGVCVRASVTTQEIGIGLHFLFPIALCTHPRAACEGRAHIATQSAELQVDHRAPHQKSRACPIENGESPADVALHVLVRQILVKVLQRIRIGVGAS